MPSDRYKTISALRLRTLWMDHTISRDEAAARAGIAPRHMQELAAKAGLPRRPIHRRPPAITNKAEFVKMWNAGLSTRDICRVT